MMAKGDPGRQETFEFWAVTRVGDGHIDPGHAETVGEMGEESLFIDFAVIENLSNDGNAGGGRGKRDATATGCLQALGEGLSDTFHE